MGGKLLVRRLPSKSLQSATHAAEFVAQPNPTNEVVHSFARRCRCGGREFCVFSNNCKLQKFESQNIFGLTADSLPAPATHAVRRVVPVVETGAPVEVVVVAELENWT